MKRYRLLLILLIGMYNLKVYSLNCSVDILQFKSDDKAYTDIMIRVDANTCAFNISDQGKLSSELYVLMLIKQGDVIKGCEKYNLTTTDLDSISDLLDLRRFVLPEGLYETDITIEDKLKEGNKFNYKSKFVVESPSAINMSDAVIAARVKRSSDNEPMNRNGVILEPLPYLMITANNPTISVYQEVYLNDFESDVLIHKTHIEKIGEDSIFINEPITSYKRLKGERIGVVLNTLDVSKLTSGRYVINTAVVDKTRKELSNKSLEIIVENRLADIGSVKDYNKAVSNSFVQKLDSATISYALRAMMPITQSVDQEMLNYAARKAPIEVMRYVLFNHWEEAYPGIAEQAYNKYMEVAKVVDNNFHSNVGYGFETDRGYIYLKYGAPSKSINVIDDPNTPPYEIWYYNSIDYASQTDVRFIFYDPLQVNNYELLHSTAYGERSNPGWPGLLYKFTGGDSSGVGRRAVNLFDEF